MLIEFSGTLLDRADRPMAGPLGVTFALYSEQSGGAALWMETQNVRPDANGNYTVLLGAATSGGLPAVQFASGKARWLSIQLERQAERPRIMLVSVAYALKAGDAETLGGLPPSAFLAGAAQGAASGSAPSPDRSASNVQAPLAAGPTKNSPPLANALHGAALPPATCTSITGVGVTNFITAWAGPCTLAPAPMTESCSANGCNMGIGTQTPQAGMDVEAHANSSVGVIGHSTATSGVTQGVYGVSDSPSGIGVHGNGVIAGEFETPTTGGTILSGLGGGSIRFTLDGLGNMQVNGGITTGSQLSLPSTADAATGVIKMGGAPFAHRFGSSNTFLGANAGNFTMTGFSNTASGVASLATNTTGSQNTASGVNALANNTTGSKNTASGLNALLFNTIGDSNTASGAAALQNNTTGSQNTACGVTSLAANTTGSNNIGIGANAGGNATTGNFNIYIGNPGVAAEGDTIRIGSVGTQTNTYIAGISTAGVSGATVQVDSTGHLGIATSSRRFKYDIDDMGEASNDLLQLRPVTFRYKQGQEDGSHPLQYGLIAEEVAKVYPELVQYGPTGEVNTVLYQELPALLLNEVQKQHAQIETQEQRIEMQREQLQVQAAQLAKLQSRIEGLVAPPSR